MDTTPIWILGVAACICWASAALCFWSAKHLEKRDTRAYLDQFYGED